VYKFKPAPVAAVPVVPKDSLGREIRKGPKGGLYVLDASGKKVYKFAATASAKRLAAAPAPPPPTGLKNTLGRTVHKGPKGGAYVVHPVTGKKVYKFTVAAANAGLALATNDTGYSDVVPTVQLKTTRIELPKILFDPKEFAKKYMGRKIVAHKAHVNRKNVFVLRDTNVDALAPWFKKQADFIKNLSMDDFMTVLAYTNKSHTWIGPYLAKGEIKTLTIVSKTFAAPLYPQMKKMIDSLDAVPDMDTVLTNVSKTKRRTVQTYYDVFTDKKNRDFMRYQAYRLMSDHINPFFMKSAMDLYAKDLQAIILRAPPIEKPMFLYRGSTTMYMKLDRKQTIDSFSSASFIPSYSLGYGTKGYHRIELAPGSHALALAIVNPWNSTGEYEILLPMHVEYTPKYDRGVKRWIVRNDKPRKDKFTYTVSDFTVKTP
jgi:hypothetical protein